MNLQLAHRNSAPKWMPRVQAAPKVPYHLEVIPLLRRIKRGGGLIALNNAEVPGDPVLASIREVNGATGRLRLACQGDPRRVQEVLRAEPVTISALSGTTKLQFNVSTIDSVEAAGVTAVEVELGDHILSYDRRRFYRMTVPVAEHVRCMISRCVDGVLCHLQMGVLDLSEGGIALLCNPHLLDLTPGMRYRDCRIQLPGADSFAITLEVRNVMQHNEAANTWVRIGCAFVDMSAVEQALIRQYIDRLEYEWRDWLPSLDFVQQKAA